TDPTVRAAMSKPDVPDTDPDMDRWLKKAQAVTDNIVEGVARAKALKGKVRKRVLPFPEVAFQEFFQAFPNHDNESLAKGGYREVMPLHVLPSTLVRAAKAYAEECKFREKRYIRTAASWLSGHCWKTTAETDGDLEDRIFDLAKELLNGHSDRH